MKLYGIRCALLATIALLSAAGARAQDPRWAEQIFEKLEHDFGNVAQGSDAKYRLKIVNKHAEPVHIAAVSTTCACANGKPSRDTLAPGETGYIEITFDTRKFKNFKDTTMTVTFDRPRFAEVRLPVKAFIRADVNLIPGEVAFGSVTPGTAVERKLSITYNGGRQDWTIKSIVNKNKLLDVKCYETGRGFGGVTYELTVALKPEAPLGEIRDQLLLVTTDPGDVQIPVLVEGRVESEYSVTPDPVDFGVLSPGMRKTVNIIIRGRTKPVTVEKIESERTAGTFEIRLPRDARQQHVLPLTVIAPEETGTLTEEFTITLGGGAPPLTFKAICKVTAGSASRVPVK